MASHPSAASVAAQSLLGLGRDRLARILPGEPSYRAGQVFRWVHARRARSFEEMTDLPETLRSRLAAHHDLSRPPVAHLVRAKDGTVKRALSLPDGLQVEAVEMHDRDRTTFCISSQVGCRFGCTFCATGTMGLARNLSAAEIIGQVMLLAEESSRSPGLPFNIVFMGMGEPMDNLDAVMEAFAILTDPDGFGLSWKRVTLSTVGHVQGLKRLGDFPRRPRLAVSLNAIEDPIRARLMPINRKWDLEALRKSVAAYPVRSGERITFEYVLLAGETDRPDQAVKLADWIGALPARVNIIPWNEHPDLPHARPSEAGVSQFREILAGRGIDVTIRYSKGRDVAAACGQLVTPLSHPSSRRETHD